MDRIRQELTLQSHRQLTAALLLLAAVVACARRDAQASTDGTARARAVQDSVNRAQPGYIVDSIFSADEETRRFNEGVARPAGLTGGAPSPRELVRRFAGALEQSDTAALRSLLVTRVEFGHFVFPESPYVRPPYKTKPLVIWTQLASESQRGLARLLERAAGDTVRISQLRCEKAPERQGSNRYWRDCTVLLSDPASRTRRMRLFGPILERDGRAKFLSYATDF
jgi:hypothetical protein